MRPPSAAAPRRSARSSTPRRGPARPASAAPLPRPAPSASGRDGRARPACSRRDQRVVAGERSLLDLWLGGAAAQLPERSGVLERGERAMASVRAQVLAGELARVERHSEDLALGDTQLDAAADQSWVERVVVAVDAHVRVGRDPGNEAAVDVGHALRQRPHHLKLLRQPIRRSATQRSVEAEVGALVEPTVELLLVVELACERAAGLEARLGVALQPLNHTLRLRIFGLQEAPADAELAAESSERLGW